MNIKKKLSFLKFSKQTFIVCSILSAIFLGTGLIYLFGPWTQGASAAWFNDSWVYRKEVPISTHSASETNVYITFQLDTASLITAGKLQSACQDIRVTDQGGNILDYHVGRTNACNNAATTIDALVPSMPAGAQTYYVYYGNPVALSKDAGAFAQPACTNSCTTNPTLGSEATQNPVTNGLAGYWKMDESTWGTPNCSTAVVLDSSGNNNNGTACPNGSGPTGGAPGKFSNGGSFDGNDDYANVTDPANGSLDSFTNMSISLWVKPAPSQKQYSNLVSKHGDNGTKQGYGIEQNSTNSNQFYFTYASGGNWYGGSGSTTVTLVANVWQHLVVEKNGSQILYYLNGALVGTDSSGNSAAITNSIYDLRIASWAQTSGREFNGSIDDLRIYNKALSSSEVTQLYNFTPGPIGYWKMDESTWGTPNCSTGVVLDSSGNGNNGTACPNGSGPTGGAIGRFDNGGSFDGSNDYVNVGDINAAEGTGQITISAWVNTNTLSGGFANLRNIIEKSDDNSDPGSSWGLRLNNSTGRIEWLVNDGAGWSGAASSGVIATNTWYHVVAIYDKNLPTASQLSIYINGTLAGNATYRSTNISANASPIYIGEGAGLQGRNWSGLLDQIQIFDRALSASEVFQLDGLLVPSLPNASPLGFWKFDEGYNTTAHNSSSSGATYDGTLNNMNPPSSGTSTTGTTVPAAGTAQLDSFGNGDGADGAVTVASSKNINTDNMISGRSCADGGDGVNYSVTSSVSAGANSVTLSSTPSAGCFAAGDEVLIINLQGTAGDNANVGKYESANILSIIGAVLTLDRNLANAYDGTTQKIMVQRVPNYTNLTVNSGVFLTAMAWNGTKGGVVFFRSSGSTTVTGSIDVVSLGFRGGIAVDNATGNQGESIAGVGTQSLSANQGGAGGGNSVGGGDTVGAAGGGGSFGVAGTTGGNCHGDAGSIGGSPGGTYGLANLSTLFLGSGGGASGDDDAGGINGGNGGPAGGIIGISASSLTVTGSILANGGDGLANNPGGAGWDNSAGGAGSGGSIRISGTTLTLGSSLVRAAGGAGGVATGIWCAVGGGLGRGGNGGAGRIAAFAPSFTSGWIQNGKFGKALSFDGNNDNVDIPSLMGTPTAVTLTGWANLRTRDSGGAEVVSIGDYVAIRLDSTAQGIKPIGQYYLGGATYAILTSSGPAVAGTGWHHFAYMTDPANSTQKLYIDGVQVASGTSSAPINYTGLGTSTKIGTHGNSDANEDFNGEIDEVKVYDQALSADQVKVDMNRSASQVMGAAGNNTVYPVQATNQRYCVPGDTTTCAGPAARFDFEQKADIVVEDVTGNNSGWEFQGTTNPHYVSGKFGSAGNFNGTDEFVYGSDIPAIVNIPAMTVETWINPSVLSDGQAIVRKGYFSNSRWEMSLSSAGEGGSDDINIDWESGTAGDHAYTTSNLIAINKWTHVVMVFDGSQSGNANRLKVFINGSQQTLSFGAAAITATTPNDNNQFEIGKTGASFWQGKIDEVTIFAYARTAPQVAWDYNKGGPVGWWKMDECQGTTINDSSGVGNIGTLVSGGGTYASPGTCTTPGATNWFNGVIGKRNYSLAFDGNDDYVDVGNDPSLQITGDITIAAWVKPTDYSNYNGIIGKTSGGGAPAPNDFYLAQGSGIPTFYRGNGGAYSNFNGLRSPVAGVWSHVVVTMSGTTVTHYLNALENGTGTLSATITDGGQNMRLGSRAGGVVFMKGQLDDVRIYRYALNAAQVKTLYNNTAINFAPVLGAP